MRGTKAKRLFAEAVEQAAIAGGTDAQCKAFYRHLKGRPQRRTGYSLPKVNVIEFDTGRIGEDGEKVMATVPKWVYQPASASTYNSRQPRRYQDRSKY